MFVDNFIINSLKLKIGRFEASYGTERLIGAVGWHNIGRSFDGGIITYEKENLNIDFFNFKTDEQFNPGDVDDNNFLGIYGNLNLNETSNLDIFLLNDWELPGSYTLRRYTAGVAYYATFGALKATGEFAYQTGNIDVNGDGLGRLDVSAMMFTANVDYDLKSMTVFGGLDYLSGDEDATDGDYGVFHTLYATNHIFYGFMDYFLNIPAHTFGKGLTDINAGVKGKYSEKIGYLAKFHMFFSSKEYEEIVTGDKSTKFIADLCNYLLSNNDSSTGCEWFFGKVGTPRRCEARAIGSPRRVEDFAPKVLSLWFALRSALMELFDRRS